MLPAHAGVIRGSRDVHLAAIHQHLFPDCYAWAGQPRYVDVGKDGAVFARVPGEVVGQMRDAQQIHATIAWKELDREGFAQALGAYAAHTNYSHPFREGNGRAAKLMYDQLAEDTEFRIDWDRVSPEEWNQASRASVAGAQRGGTPDPAPLIAVFRGMTAPRDQDTSTTVQHAAKAGTPRPPPSSPPPPRPDRPHHDRAASDTTRRRHRHRYLPGAVDKAIEDNRSAHGRSRAGA